VSINTATLRKDVKYILDKFDRTNDWDYVHGLLRVLLEDDIPELCDALDAANARANRLAAKIKTEQAAEKAWDTYMCYIGRPEVSCAWREARKAKEAAQAAILPSDLE
jgi:hypothetical protein